MENMIPSIHVTKEWHKGPWINKKLTIAKSKLMFRTGKLSIGMKRSENRSTQKSNFAINKIFR